VRLNNGSLKKENVQKCAKIAKKGQISKSYSCPTFIKKGNHAIALLKRANVQKSALL